MKKQIIQMAIIDFGKDPFLRHIKKVFKGYFEKNAELERSFI